MKLSKLLKKSWLALIVPSPTLIVPLPVNRFPDKIAAKVPKNLLRNHTILSFASFLIVLLHLLLINQILD